MERATEITPLTASEIECICTQAFQGYVEINSVKLLSNGAVKGAGHCDLCDSFLDIPHSELSIQRILSPITLEK